MRFLRDKRGFTLVELVVTAMFITTASLAIITIFILIATLNKHARNLAIATALANEKLETYRDAGFSAIPMGSPAETFTSSLPANFGSPKSAVSNVTLVPTKPGLKQVDVVISYYDDKQLKKVQVTTLVAQRGIKR